MDGSADTRLSFGREQDVQWMLVDLGAEQTVNRVVIDFFEGITEYKLYASDDGETWTDLVTVTGQATPTAPVFFDLETAVTTKNVRIYVTKRGGTMVQLSELAVFGTPGRYDLRAWQPEGTENAALNKMVSVSSDYVAPEGIWGSMLLNDGYIRGVVGYGGANGWKTLPVEGASAVRKH